MKHFVFPRWANRARNLAGIALGLGPLYAFVLVYYVGSPRTTDVGYTPKQPVAYSHALHAGELGMDCRYCHNTVQDAAHAALPPTQTCMNCHQRIWTKSAKLLPVRESWATGEPIEWVRVHDLPDYVYFNHSAHVGRGSGVGNEGVGVGCVSCHGRIDQMVEVEQAKSLSMAWCLGCHRAPNQYLRPVSEVTNMAWQPPGGQDPATYGASLREKYDVNPPTDCSTCHR
jgi:hypothetical protein